MTRWEKLRELLAPFEREEPGLEGLRWPLYLVSGFPWPRQRPERIILSKLAAWLRSMRYGIARAEGSVWYGIHGASPAHEMPFASVHAELSRRGVTGTLLGPHPFSPIHVSEGWVQRPLVGGSTAGSPLGVFLGLRRVARKYAGEIGAAAHDAPDVFEEPPDAGQLLALVWNTLAIDREMEQLVRKDPPRVIVVGSDLGPTRNPLVRHGRNQGCFTLVLQHGLLGEYAGSVTAQEVSLWGDYHREVALGHGAPPDSQVVDGSPRMDMILEAVSRPDSRSAACEAIGIPRDVPVLLHLLDNLGLLERRFPTEVGAFREAASSVFADLRGRVTVVVRPHPSDSDTDWGYLERAGAMVVPPGRTPLTSAIAAADVVSTMVSTAGLEALWCGRPLVFFRPGDRLPLGDLVSRKAGPCVSEASDWAALLLELLECEEARRKQLERSSNFCEASLAFPGQAARRVADRIERHLC